MKLRVLLLAMPVVVLVLLVVSFFFARQSVDPNANQVVFGTGADASFLNPFLHSDVPSGSVCDRVFNGLVKYDRDLFLTGDLAESWEVEKGEKPVITFHLRKGVRWHDGEPFTAEDVKFTYEAIMDENTKTVRSPDYELVEKLWVVDAHTVRMRYREPFSPGLESWAMGMVPKHILENEDINTAPFNRAPVGTGPFRFKEWTSDEKIVLEANDDYFEGRPLVDRMVFRIIPESSLREMEMLTGGVDLSGVSYHSIERMKEHERFDIYSQLNRGYSYVGYNMARDLFKDKRVRHALTHAINRQEMLDFILYGHGEVATGIFSPQMWAYNHDVKPLAYDPDRSRELLAEAGWKDSDGDGWLDRDGVTFSFSLMTSTGGNVGEDIVVLVQEQLQRVGIKVETEFYEWSVFLDRYLNKRNFDACVLGWSIGIEPDQYQLWHSSQIEKGLNFVAYNNPEVDRLLEAGRREYELEERQKIYHRIHKLISEDQPYTFLVVSEPHTALAKRFVLMEKTGEGDREGRGRRPQKIRMEKIGLTVDLIDWKVNPRHAIALP